MRGYWPSCEANNSPDRVLREFEELVAVKPGLVLLDLVFDPGQVELTW